LPRGLGDDPLSRQRKNAAAKRSGASTAAPTAVSPIDDSLIVSSTAQPSVQNIAEAPSSSAASTSSSYNDVFFQKRDGTASAVTTAVATQDVVVTEPAPAPVVAAPLQPSLSQEEHAAEIAIPAEPTPAIAAVHEIPAPDLVQTQTPAQVQPEPQKGGFFSRVFGKLRK
jgi:hypothetical protein